jgi:hypothetical protein
MNVTNLITFSKGYQRGGLRLVLQSCSLSLSCLVCSARKAIEHDDEHEHEKTGGGVFPDRARGRRRPRSARRGKQSSTMTSTTTTIKKRWAFSCPCSLVVVVLGPPDEERKSSTTTRTTTIKKAAGFFLIVLGPLDSREIEEPKRNARLH